ncbi:MAG: hypothetical protein ACR2F2_10490 [Pyrinomonadaceae bacterium]
MAIWQFSIEFIPRKKLINYFGQIPDEIDEEIYWKEDFKSGVLLPVDYEVLLNSLAQKEKLKWTKASYNWGDYDDGTHITINLENKNEVDIYARFHGGELKFDFIYAALKLAKQSDCVFVTSNRTIFEPYLTLFMEELKKSGAYKFCKDPKGYLQSDELKQLSEEVKRKLDNNEFDFNS